MLSAFKQEPKDQQAKEDRKVPPRQSALTESRLLDILHISALRNNALLNQRAAVSSPTAAAGSSTLTSPRNAEQEAIKTLTAATAAIGQAAAMGGQAATPKIAHLVAPHSTQEHHHQSPTGIDHQEGKASAPRISVMNGDSQQQQAALGSPGAAVPAFPFMIHPEICGLSMQEIAKEAMRIAKESIRKQQVEALSAESGLIHKTHAPAVAATSPQVPAGATPSSPPSSPTPQKQASSTAAASSVASLRLNKFVRRLHDMVKSEQDKGIVEWRRGLLVLHSTATFAKTILPKFFNTRNFKTFRRQLNYYGFVHVRSFSNTAASTTTALWVHQELAATLHGMASTPAEDPDDLMHILKLRRVEPNDDHKTVEGRRQRKELALYTVEEDLQVSTKSLQRQQIQSLLSMSSAAALGDSTGPATARATAASSPTGDLPPAGTPTVAGAQGKVPSQARAASIISDPEDEQKQARRGAPPSSATSSTKKKKRKSPSRGGASRDVPQTKKMDCRRYVSDGSVVSLVSTTKPVAKPERDDQKSRSATRVGEEDSAANLLLLLSRGS